MAATDAPDPHVLSPGTAPTPFTADEIRVGCPDGRTVVLSVTNADGAVQHRMSRFIDGDEHGATYERGACTAAGEPIGEPERRGLTWLQLQGHASFPVDAVVIDSQTVDLAIGQLDCLRYVVTDGADVTTFWFATALPGMPVRVLSETDGTVQERAEMAANLLP